jgi:hypothetical protein
VRVHLLIGHQIGHHSSALKYGFGTPKVLHIIFQKDVRVLQSITWSILGYSTTVQVCAK